MSGPANTQFTVAVHVLTYLAVVARERSVSSDELAESVNVSPVYVRRVLGPLRDAGMVTSRPGAHGGWELARPAGAVRLDEVWTAVAGAERVLARHSPDPHCPVGRGVSRVLDGITDDAAAAVRRSMHRRTVRDVLDEAGLAAARRG